MSCSESKCKIAVVIPCYNVASTIVDVVSGIKNFADYIITINDGSNDNTKDILLELSKSNSKLTVLNNSKNQGVGAAMIRGFYYSMQKDCDVVIKLDGDGQMDASYITEMIDSLHKGYDFVKGNRFFDRTSINKIPIIRINGNMGMGFLLKAVSGYWNISDG